MHFRRLTPCSCPQWTAGCASGFLLFLSFGDAGLAADTPPLVSILNPGAGASFVAPTESLVVQVQDDQPVPAEKLTLLLNGSRPTSGFFSVSRTDDGRTLRLELARALSGNMDYVFQATAADSAGATATAEIYFDTFDPNSIVVEGEDYNFQSGKFIDSPEVTPEGAPSENAYWGKTATPEVDFHDATTNPGSSANPPRPEDAVGTDRATDFLRQKFSLAGGPENNVQDYAVRHVRKGEWLNYTRNFVVGAYEARLRESVLGLQQSATVLNLLLTGATNETQTTVPLGVFLSPDTAGRYRTIPLTDGLGKNKVLVRLGGEKTVRLAQETDDPTGESIWQNFLIFIPAADPGVLGPVVARVSPLPGETVQAASLAIAATIVNRDRAVNPDSIRFQVNGSSVKPSVWPGGAEVSVTFAPPSLPPSGSTNVLKLRFADTAGVEQIAEWTFVFLLSGVPQLESAATVTGPFVPDDSAVVDPQTQTIRATRVAPTMFYRLGLAGAANSPSLTIDSIKLQDTEVVFRYHF
jgi:hypothetical protein